MLDFAVREVFFALLATIIPIEPSIAPGAGLARAKAGRVAINAISEPVDYPVAAEAPPGAGANVNVARNWLVRTAAGALGVKVLNVAPGQVDVRIFME